VVGPETSNGVVKTRSPGPAAPAKSDAGRRSGIPAADISDHATEADGGDTTVSSPEMAAAEKKRGIFSMFRRKKDAKETKLDTAKESRSTAAAAALVISPLRHRRHYLPTVILIIIGRAALSIWPYTLHQWLKW